MRNVVYAVTREKLHTPETGQFNTNALVLGAIGIRTISKMEADENFLYVNIQNNQSKKDINLVIPISTITHFIVEE